MPVVSLHVSSNLRLLRGDGYRLATFTRINPAINAPGVEMFLSAFNLLRDEPATGAVLTTQTELSRP